MVSAFGVKEVREKLGSFVIDLFKVVVISVVLVYLSSIFLFYDSRYCSSSKKLFYPSSPENESPLTNLSHIAFGLLGSVKTWHHRKAYIESWWRPNLTRGYVFLDKAPDADLLPWSKNSPQYRISEDQTKLVQEIKSVVPPLHAKMVHGILELFREEHEGIRWVIMGDDDTVFFLDNIVDVLSTYDHTKYYYFGVQSEYVLSNYWFSFSQGFGGAGFILSYPLAKALSEDMDSCLRRYPYLRSADQITMACIVDLGVSVTPHKGLHQMDLRGDYSGFLSYHPQAPLLSLHHFDVANPIYPKKDRIQSTQHLFKAASFDQSRILQQTICYHRPSNWSFSVSWGYSVHIYEKTMPRSYLQYPIETFGIWGGQPKERPYFMFSTRLPSKDPCEAPHAFFLDSLVVTTDKNQNVATYSRSSVRGLPPCSQSGNHSADYITKIQVYSRTTKRIEMDRCECCDVSHMFGSNDVKIKLRECLTNEKIA